MFTVAQFIIATAAALAIGLIVGRLAAVRAADFPGSSDETEPPAAADPWEVQRAVMEASGQDLPDGPALTNGTLLYGALVMEEVGETLEALEKVMAIVLLGEQRSPQDPEMVELWGVREAFAQYADGLQSDAARVRERLGKVGPIYMPMSGDEAVELLDGLTDVVVVTCGMANASGLPGAAAYEEVGESNLSKRNPDTGVIDKTPDGKWIKGRDYRAPDLAAVLRRRADDAPGPYGDLTPAA